MVAHASAKPMPTPTVLLTTCHGVFAPNYNSTTPSLQRRGSTDGDLHIVCPLELRQLQCHRIVDRRMAAGDSRRCTQARVPSLQHSMPLSQRIQRITTTYSVSQMCCQAYHTNGLSSYEAMSPPDPSRQHKHCTLDRCADSLCICAY